MGECNISDSESEMASLKLGTKMWGREKYFGVSFDYDPQWILTDEQKVLQARLIKLCHDVLRANAVNSDATYEYPRKNFVALSELGLMGLIVPKELGGLGETHTCAAMVVEVCGMNHLVSCLLRAFSTL